MPMMAALNVNDAAARGDGDQTGQRTVGQGDIGLAGTQRRLSAANG